MTVARDTTMMVALVLGGCVGTIGGGSGDGERDGDEQGVSAAAVPLRRLTAVEYDNTVRDLLGDTTRPGASFPLDEATGGYESNNTAPVTDMLVQRYLDAAEALAGVAVQQLEILAPCAEQDAAEACAATFIETFGRRAFRRPLDPAEVEVLAAVYAEKVARSDHAGGIQLVLQAMLQSPQFLYRIEEPPSGSAPAPLAGYDVATRLSYLLWASTPDAELLDAAGAGALATAQGVEVQARRLLEDPRSTDAVRSFHRQWLRLRELASTEKDTTMFPEYTLATRAAMVEETLSFAAYAVAQGGDTVETLLTSPRSFVDGQLAALYGLAAPADGLVMVDMPDGQRSGVLTHASVMSLNSNANQGSPILRGKFVRENILCQALPPAPPDVDVTPPPLDPTLTTKERFSQHREDPSCAGCHDLMDPIGFAFEHYDAIGRWRTMDGDNPVDATGELTHTDDLDGPVNGAVELGQRLAGSAQVKRCMTRQWFRFALGRGEQDAETASLDSAEARYADGGYDVRELLVGIAVSDAFRFTKSEPGGEP
jgi:hypothetical protein